MSATLVVNEVYLSLQGESTFAGLPCVFIRLTACNLRCSYCDTAYAFTEGKKWPVDGVLSRVRELASPFVGQASSLSRTTYSGEPMVNQDRLEACPTESRLPLVELTGGEPLLQPNSLPLMKQLCDEGFTVLIETSGAHDISGIDRRVRRIVDLKCPSSGEVARNRYENIPDLKATDEVKFVIGTVEDYEWSKQQLAEHRLVGRCAVLFSWVAPLLPEQRDKSLKAVPGGQTPIGRKELVERIIADALPVRFQVQMHKVIWPPEQRGV